MSSTIVAIELLSDRMDVAAIKGGRVVSTRRIPLELPSEPTAWAKAVCGSSKALQEAVTELNVAGAPSRVLYRSPTQAVDLASHEMRSAQQALEAAMLPAGEALPYSVASAVLEGVVVGRDKAGPKRHWHVVVAADRIDIARSLATMVDEAGLSFMSATPLDAAILARLVRQALGHKLAQHGWLHFGNHSSFFILGGEGRVRFERSIGVGVETIVQSLTRPIRMPEEEAIELDYATAKKVLLEHGIPETDEVIDQDHKLTRRHIMPQIQPALQRYVVELRQSLRFGLPENERSNIEITVGGPGSTIPGLAQLIAWELKLSLTSDPRYSEYDYRTPGASGSELADGVEDRDFLASLNLQPPESAQKHHLVRMRKCMWVGAAAALALVAYEGVRLQRQVTQARKEDAALKAAHAELNVLKETHDRMLKALRAMNEVEEVIVREVGARASLRAILQELSLLTPRTVQINSMRFSREDDVLLARLYGRAILVHEKGDETDLESFIESLKTSPLFRKAVLRNVEAGRVEGGSGQRFEAAFEVVLAPDSTATPSVAASLEGDEP